MINDRNDNNKVEIHLVKIPIVSQELEGNLHILKLKVRREYLFLLMEAGVVDVVREINLSLQGSMTMVLPPCSWTFSL